MFNAPPYKTKELKNDVTVWLKVYVPFASENDRKEFMRQQIEEENDEIDEENPETAIQSTDLYKSDPPDCKYESTKFDFKYTPNCKFNL